MKYLRFSSWTTTLGQFILFLLISSLYQRVAASSSRFSVTAALSFPDEKDERAYTENILQIATRLPGILEENFNDEFLNWLNSTGTFEKIYPLPHDVVSKVAPLPGANPVLQRFQYIQGATQFSSENSKIVVFLSIPPGKTEDNQLYYQHNLAQVIRDEFFHVACVISNLNKISSTNIKDNPHLLAPFLNAQGKIDKSLLSKFTQVLRLASSRFRLLLKIFEKSVATRTQEEANFLAAFEKCLENYTPHVHVTPNIPSENFKQLSENIVNAKDGSFIAYEDGTVHKIFSIREQKHFEYGKVTHLFRTSHSNTNSKLEVFIKDLQDAHMPDYETKVGYGQLIEHGSILFSYFPEVIKFVAPEFCTYMMDYLSLTNSICDVANKDGTFQTCVANPLANGVCLPPKQSNVPIPQN